MKSAWPTLTAAVLAAALLTGCSSPAPTEDTPASSSADAANGSGGAANGSAAGTQPDSGVGVASADAGTVLAEQDYTLPGTEDTVTIGVHSLVVDGKTMTLKLVMTPDFSSVSDNETVSIYDMKGSGAGYFNPQLVDRKNLKEYAVVRDGPTQWASNSVDTETTNGEPVIWWGVYAAPEDDIDTFDLRVLPGVPEFTNVPITR